MKTVSPALNAHLSEPVTTLCTCWKIVRKDSTIMGFTEHDTDILYDGLIYKASTSYSPTSFSTNATLSVDNLEIKSFLDDDDITEQDLMSGVYDYAGIFIFLINWADISQGIVKLQRGILGEVTIIDEMFVAEMRSMTQHLQQTIGRTYSPDCDADLGDSRCTVSLGTITVTGSVTSLSNNRIFTDTSRVESNGLFDFGELTWTSGLNNSRKIEVIDFNSSIFTLFEKMPFNIVIGDTYSVYSGCNRTKDHCKNKHNNLINFRGFDFIPGIDATLRTPDAN